MKLPFAIPRLPKFRFTTLQVWQVSIAALALLAAAFLLMSIFVFITYGIGWNKNISGHGTPPEILQEDILLDTVRMLDERASTTASLREKGLGIRDPF